MKITTGGKITECECGTGYYGTAKQTGAIGENLKKYLSNSDYNLLIKTVRVCLEKQQIASIQYTTIYAQKKILCDCKIVPDSINIVCLYQSEHVPQENRLERQIGL